jgi:hypothetical protein
VELLGRLASLRLLIGQSYGLALGREVPGTQVIAHGV